MKTIDFLPPELRNRNEVRSLRLWWLCVGLAFSGFVVATATMQFLRKRDVQRHLARIDTLCQNARQQEARVVELSHELSRASQTADLIAFLEHPWPRSRILCDALTPLPESVTLTELALHMRGPAMAARPAAARVNQVVTQEAENTLEPAEADLKTLRNQCETASTVLELRGTTENVPELHQYVARLNGLPLFQTVKLEGLEALEEPKGKNRLQFTMHIRLQPAYGLAGGPSEQTADARQILQWRERPARSDFLPGPVPEMMARH
jgi:Tfp pilus assembly protein PilN